jgi:hypothetical protein
MKKSLISLALLASILTLQGCSTDADVASANLSLAADSFQIERRIVFINTWTNTYLLSVTGLCSIKSAKETTGDAGVAVTCKVSPTEYKKHYLGLSGNVTYFSEQIGPAQVGVYHYKVVFKPSVIVPDVDMQ